jgi:hypothetical protein
MSVTVNIDTTALNRGMAELQRITGAEDGLILRNTMKGVMWNLVRFTFLMRRIKNKKFRWMQKGIESAAKGRARLGWWPAWKALRLSGAPKIGNGPLKDRGEGGVIDKSRSLNSPYITVFNEVPYIEASNKKMQTVSKAIARQAQFLARAVDREYSKILRRTIG